MVFNLYEIIDIILMSLVVGFIFTDTFLTKKISHVNLDDYDPIKAYSKKGLSKDKWNKFLYAIALVAPAVIFHEIGHKFVAMYFGAQATFHAAYTWLFLGVVLKLMNFGFIFFVPAYVSWSGNVTDLQAALIAFAGPAVNMLFWLVSLLILKLNLLDKNFKKYIPYLSLFGKINMFLFIFNMLPIPGFDGSKVFSYLFSYFF
jgi:Zn-dependent protease